MKRSLSAVIYLVVCLGASTVEAQPARPAAAAAMAVTVVNAGPQGELASHAEGNEVRVVFSEPMVALGRIPEPLRPAFFAITPAVRGTFRWSGTTILIFTADPKRPLPFATTYKVTIAGTATAVSGRKLGRPFSFSFTTPTVRLISTQWYRQGDRFDGKLLIVTRFNQRVRAADVAAHLTARFARHDWHVDDLDGLRARLKVADPRSLEQLNAKVAATQAAAASTAAVPITPAATWDKKRHRPAGDTVVFEASVPTPPNSWIKLTLDARVPSPSGTATPGKIQEYTVELEPPFFVNGVACATRCDPDDANPIEWLREVLVKDFAQAASVRDVTTPDRQVALSKLRAPRGTRQDGDARDVATELTLEDAGFDPQPPARTYTITVDASLRAVDGEPLGYTWIGRIENWHRLAFTSFGDGHGVWETGGGTQLPFYARNYREATQWAAPIQRRDLMPTIIKLTRNHFREAPVQGGVARQLGVAADRVQSHGLDISKALNPTQTGLVWAAVTPGAPLPQTKVHGGVATRASIVQVTNLGISVKDSPQNTLIFVTRLDNGAPVPGAAVSIVRLDNSVFWRGTTGADGVAMATDTPLRDPKQQWDQFKFLVTAEKDGDIAYVGSDWTEGTSPWEFDAHFDLGESTPMLRGTVFTDRGVYRLGEEVHFKAVLRHNTTNGVRLLPAGTRVQMSVHDSQDRAVDTRTIALNAWSSADWTLTLPGDGALGNYRIRAVLESDLPKPQPPARAGETRRARDEDTVAYQKAVYSSFLVAAYRRPDFRVDVTLTATNAITGTPLKGSVNARYLFGAAMGARPVKWTFSRRRGGAIPKAIVEKFPEEQWEFVGQAHSDYYGEPTLQSKETTLEQSGSLPLELATTDSRGVPWYYVLEGDVEDVSRQHIANRAGVTVHPAPWYVGVKRLPYFAEQKNGVKTAIVAVDHDGSPVAGVPVELVLEQIQWNSVRRSEGGGFYTWDSEQVVVPIGKWNVTTAATPVPFEIQLPNGGNFILRATGRGPGDLFAVTESSFYALGDGYTAWARFDHNRIDLVPERKTWKPGDTARIMIQSPWETATALVTTEREGIRSHRQFALTSTQHSIAVPITEADIPNVFVSVLLVKGRTVPPRAAAGAAAAAQGDATPGEDASDPGKPSFRLGYIELKVEDTSKRLTVVVAANKEEYRPANAAKIDLTVTDHQGRGTASEVTLWAVDYGVLSLTAYRTPDVLRSVYVEKALQVMNTDSRQRIISRRVLTPKGATDGGGGGADSGAGTIRKDFRVLAFWLGSVTTDANGLASVDIKLPESLTTYRIMAVAGDRGSRFGSGDSEVRVNKPITLKPAWPRFLAVGDTAHFGAVVTSQLAAAGTALVTMKSLDTAVLDLAPGTQLSLPIGAGGSVEARFQAFGKAIGRARVQMTVKVGTESDAFEDVIPVEVLVSPETVAAYGEASDASAVGTESLTIPRDVVPAFGGLHVDLSSTAMVGLGEGARYLVEYPYGCAEQKGSRAIALLLAADLGDAFTLPGMDTAQMKPAVQRAMKELERFQCGNGGFAYWAGACWSTSPYLTAYLLHVFKTAADMKYDVDASMRERAYVYLEKELGEKPPENEGWWPSYTAWQAFAVKVLAEGGRNQDSNITRLYGYRDRMPVFALAYLYDALVARKETATPRAVDLRRRMNNAILPEGGRSHVGELTDPSLLWYWSSEVRSTAIVLNSLVRGGGVPGETGATADQQIPSLVRWLMAARKDGRWGNTQENAHAMEALVAYYRKFEATVPDFSAVVTLGAKEIAREQFKGRSTESKSRAVAMATIVAQAPAGASMPLTFARQGAGTLFYTARFRYTADSLFQEGLDTGIHIERSYAPYDEKGTRPPSLVYDAGDMVRITLRFRLTKERRFLAVTDPLPAGFEPVEAWFATTAQSLATDQGEQSGSRGWMWWQRGGFDHVERHDNRVELFATSLAVGDHTFSYIVRATTAGTFRTAPAHAEEMYTPEVFGRTATTIIEIRK